MAVETELLPPRYRSPKLVARGGMGEIYRATDDTLGRAVAVKLLSERYAEDSAVRQRFTREALAAARLSGEANTVTIFDVGDWNGRPFIVMEYLAGGSLDDRIKKDGGQKTAQALQWLEQAAAALDAAHREGVVHRDVKPANLLLDRDGNVHVADFGIARAAGLDSLTMTGTVLGTAGYLSPEQARGEPATDASDRYALAVVAFELFCGRRPFQNDSMTAEAAAHVNSPVPSVAAVCAGLPEELDSVFQKALAKDPAERFESCVEFVACLRDALSEAAGRTRQIAPVAAVAGPVRALGGRRLWPLVLGLLLAATLAGGILAAVLLGGGDDGGGGGKSNAATQAPRTQVRTLVKTVAGPGTTVRETVTTTTTTPAAKSTSTSASPPSSESGSSLNDRGFALMQQGRYSEALPLLEQSVDKLRGSGSITEAYASYNLAFTRFQLGRCDDVVALLDRSESIQGRRKEIDRLRKDAKKRC